MNDPQAVTRLANTAHFATTQWGMVVATGRADSPEASGALSRLCQTYWYPLYAYVRSRGFGEHEAKDLTQGFFQQLLTRNDLAKADPQRGRFRSFLLKSMQHYLANERRKARRLKRGGGQPIIALDASAETRYGLEPQHELTPDRLYERRWAMAVIAATLDRLRDDYAAAGQADLYAALEGSLTGSGRGGSLAEIGRRLELSEGAVKVAAHRMRKRFGKLLREVIGETVASPEEVEAELAELRAVIQDGLTTLTP